MILCIGNVLNEGQLQALRQVLGQASFRNGKDTAGWHARLVKNNEQADSRDKQVTALRQTVGNALENNPVFQMSARPLRSTPVMFSRYRIGMTYGNHVDDPVMGSGPDKLRTDLSFTLFLSDPDSYEGGELVTDTSAGESSYKLPAGALVLYPSSTLHRVEPVSSGERLVAVGWIQSTIRDPGHREILFDIDTARRQLFDRDGKSREFDLLSKSLSNLQRMWAEI